MHDHCSNLSLTQYNDEEQQFYAAPTIQEAAQWLLDNHKVFIEVSPNINDKFCFYASIYRRSEESWEEILPSQMNEAEENYVAFDDPTEAWQYAISICLKYLI